MFSNNTEVLYSSNFRCLLKNLWALVGFRGGVAWLSASLYLGWGGVGWAISLLRNPISLAWLEGYPSCGFTVGSPGLRGSSARRSDVQRGAARSREAQQGASPPWHHWWCAARGALQGTEKEKDISKHAWHSLRAWATRSVTSLCGFLHHLQLLCSWFLPRTLICTWCLPLWCQTAQCPTPQLLVPRLCPKGRDVELSQAHLQLWCPVAPADELLRPCIAEHCTHGNKIINT